MHKCKLNCCYFGHNRFDETVKALNSGSFGQTTKKSNQQHLRELVNPNIVQPAPEVGADKELIIFEEQNKYGHLFASHVFMSFNKISKTSILYKYVTKFFLKVKSCGCLSPVVRLLHLDIRPLRV